VDSVKLKRFVELEKERRDLEGRINSIAREVEGLEQFLLTEFEEAGMSSARVDDITVYTHRQLWARPKEGNMETACKILKQVGLGEVVKESFNMNTLSAYVREKDRSGEKLPEGFENGINIEERFSLRSRR